MMSGSGPRFSLRVFTLAGECSSKLAEAASNSGRPGAGIAHCSFSVFDSSSLIAFAKL
jgi:hypothetical protein